MFRSFLIRNVRELFIRKLVLVAVTTEKGSAISKFNPKMIIRIEALAAKKLYKETSNVSEARKISVRIQEKFTLPFAYIVFGLIGSSLGSKSNNRATKSQGFGLSVILILFYYVLSFISNSFGVKGLIPPILFEWIPFIISLSGGLFLLRKSS